MRERLQLATWAKPSDCAYSLREVEDYPAVTTICVSRGWDDVEGPIEPKSQKGRKTVPVASALRRYLLEHKMRTGRDSDELLFGRTATEPFTPNHVRRRALKAWAAANERRELERLPPLEPLGFHAWSTATGT
jgi:hypothetical protein